MDALAIAELIREIRTAAASFGVSACVLLAIIVGGVVIFWRLSRWLRPHVDAVIDAQLTLMRTASDTLPRISEAAEATSQSVKVLADAHTKERSALAHISRGIEASVECTETRKVVTVHMETAREALE